MADEDDSALVRDAAAGDRAAFARLVGRHHLTIYKIAYKWCGNRPDAEDIAQDVCVKLPSVLGSFRGDSGFTTWLYRITVNAAKDHGRKRGGRREQAFAEGFDAASGEVPADERMIAVESFAVVHALPEPIRDAVLLVFAEEMSHKQAAKVLGCAEATISWRIHQARKLLKANNSLPRRGRVRVGASVGRSLTKRPPPNLPPPGGGMDSSSSAEGIRKDDDYAR